MNEVVATLAQRTDLRVMLTGYADASGNREANLRLSRLRAQAVRDYLLASGLPAHRILINFFGDEKAQGSHTDRRVELRYIPRD
jgi:outer membrane protein OmpA-like peptidoglycan-associated protein